MSVDRGTVTNLSNHRPNTRLRRNRDPVDDTNTTGIAETLGLQGRTDANVGSVHAPNERDQRALDHRASKLRRRGWSETKIRRWLNEEDKTHAKEERIYHLRADGPDAAGVDHWLDLLNHLLRSEHLDHVGIRVSWVPPDWSENTQSVRLPDLKPELLRTMAEDTLYVFTV